MPNTPSIVITKNFQYKGKTELWSSKYHFSGTTPGSAADWRTLAEAIFNAEKGLLASTIKLDSALGYAAGNPHSVWQASVATGSLTQLGGALTFTGQTPGDCTVDVRWSTPDRNSRGRPIYLRKYFHGAFQGADADSLSNSQATPAATYAAKMIDGTLPGGFKVCGPQGAVASNPIVNPKIGYRQLRRRGKRPH